MNHFPKKAFILALSLLFLFSCKDEQVSPACVTLEMHETWPQEEFKAEYNIQFPSSYAGNGRTVHFEGEYFDKSYGFSEVSFSSSYCDGTFCPAYGPEKPAGVVTSINGNGDAVALDQREDYCKNGQISAEFHYNINEDGSNTHIVGKFFLLKDGSFIEAMEVLFRPIYLDEVITILSTIEEN